MVGKEMFGTFFSFMQMCNLKYMVLLFPVLLVAGSCKKERGPSYSNNLIVGTWYVNQSGVDRNANDSIDYEENNYRNHPGMITVYAFKQDNTVMAWDDSSGHIKSKISYSWQLQSGNKELRLAFDGRETVFAIVKLTGKEMVLRRGQEISFYRK